MDSLRLIALLSPRGTACSETVLVSAEDTPWHRAAIEKQFCLRGPDDPVHGTWTDVTDNEAFAGVLDDFRREQRRD